MPARAPDPRKKKTPGTGRHRVRAALLALVLLSGVAALLLLSRHGGGQAARRATEAAAARPSPVVEKNTDRWLEEKRAELAEEATLQGRSPELEPAIQAIKTRDVYLPLRILVRKKAPPETPGEEAATTGKKETLTE